MEHQGEVTNFVECIKEEFERLYELYNVAEAPQKRQPDKIDAIWQEIYDLVFKPDVETTLLNNQKSKLLTYKVYDVESVTDEYIRLNRLYGGFIKVMSFCELTGIHRSTLKLWNDANKTNGYIFNLKDNEIDEEKANNIIYINNTIDVRYNGNCRHNSNDKLSSLRFDVMKKLRDAARQQSRNVRSLDGVSAIQMSNEDEELGFCYGDKNRMHNMENIRQQIGASGLKQLGLGIDEKMGAIEVKE